MCTTRCLPLLFFALALQWGSAAQPITQASAQAAQQSPSGVRVGSPVRLYLVRGLIVGGLLGLNASRLSFFKRLKRYRVAASLLGVGLGLLGGQLLYELWERGKLRVVHPTRPVRWPVLLLENSLGGLLAGQLVEALLRWRGWPAGAWWYWVVGGLGCGAVVGVLLYRRWRLPVQAQAAATKQGVTATRQPKAVASPHLSMMDRLFPSETLTEQEPIGDMQVALMLDFILLLLLLMGMYRGFNNGLLSQLFSSVTLFIFLMSGMRLFRHGLRLARSWWPQLGDSLPFVTFILFCSGGLLSLILLERMIRYVTRLTFLGYLDSLLGAGLGVGQTALLLSIFINTAISLELGLPQQYTVHMHLYEPMRQLAPRLLGGIEAFFPGASRFFAEAEAMARAMLRQQ